MRLRPGLRVLWRGPDEVQIGTDPRWAVRLTGLTPREVAALTSLPDGAALPDLGRRPTSAASPAGAGTAPAVVDALADAGLLVEPAPQRSAPAVPPLPSGAAADAAVWSLVLDAPDGAAMVRARSGRVVGVLGAGRLGLSAAVVLASAGVGTVLLDDASPVTTRDLGVGGFSARDVGSRRDAAAARVLRDLVPEVRTSAAERTRPDVVVTVEHGVADAVPARTMMAAEVVHLSVVVREADVVVGPLIRPGTSPCLRCLDLHRADVDPAWPVLAAQLATQPAPASASVERRGRAPAQESVLAAVGGALAAAQVLAELDGRSPVTVGASLEVALPDAVPRLRTWPVHPDCGCTGLPTAAVGDRAGRRRPA